MNTCSLTNLPITENENWQAAYDENGGYKKVFKRLGDDIIVYTIESSHPVFLDSLNVDLLKTVLHDSNLEKKPVCFLWDMANISGMSYPYKKQLTNIFFSPDFSFSPVIFYNVAPVFATTVEMFTAIAPGDSRLHIMRDYSEAVTAALNWEKGIPPTSTTTDENDDEEKYEQYKKEFLAAIGRISWLDMMDQKILMPPRDNELFPFFKAIDNLQHDLLERAREKEQELEYIEKNGEKTLNEKTILLNAQKELYKKIKSQLEKEISALTGRIATQEMELTRISTAVAEKTSTLRELLEMINSLDIDQTQKRAMIDICQNMIDTEMIEKRLNTELTTTDSEFLSKLQKRHPNLNQRELRICLLIKLNYNTRDIARSIGISTRGMESIRYRMHKKVGLAKHQSLKGYLTDMIMEDA